MGEAADDMLGGNACEQCGVWLISDAGEMNEGDFPCLCKPCWERLPSWKKKEMCYFDPRTGRIAGGGLQPVKGDK